MSCDLPPVDDDKLMVNGLPDSDNPILPDQFLTFSCKGPRLMLIGSPMVICGKSGKWDSPFPTCDGKTFWRMSSDLMDKTVFQLIQLCFLCYRDSLQGAANAPWPQGHWASTRQRNVKDRPDVAFLLQQWQMEGRPWRNPVFGKRRVEFSVSYLCWWARFLSETDKWFSTP